MSLPAKARLIFSLIILMVELTSRGTHIVILIRETEGAGPTNNSPDA